MIPNFAWIDVDSMGNGNDSNHFHISSYIFCTEKPANVEKSPTDTTETEAQQPSTGETTSPPPGSSSEATSAAQETTCSSGKFCPKWVFQFSIWFCKWTVSTHSISILPDIVRIQLHMLEATHFPDYNFYTE